jgi:hypothetical protein
MQSHLSRRALAVTGTVLLLALATTGCGRRGIEPGAAAATATAGTPAATVGAPGPDATGDPGETAGPDATGDPGASAEPGSNQVTAATPKPSAAPLATPDLTAIQQLLDDLDAALGADATADTDEGSAP